jgi:NhaP-type Na+/H+ or K+/H+ antiporter
MCLLGRAANIFPLSYLCNQFRTVKITGTSQTVMWFAGLRGAIAFALALNLKGYYPHYQSIITMTLVVILFTVFIFGGGMLPLLKLLKNVTVQTDKAAIIQDVDDKVGLLKRYRTWPFYYRSPYPFTRKSLPVILESRLDLIYRALLGGFQN